MREGGGILASSSGWQLSLSVPRLMTLLSCCGVTVAMECNILREQFEQGDGAFSAISSDISLEELERLLEKHKIDTSKFVKTLRDLQKEIQVRDCFLNVLDGALVRMVQPVFVKLRYKDRVLVNCKDIYLHRNNMERIRSCVMSEKMFPQESPLISSIRGIVEEIGVDQDTVTSSVKHIKHLDQLQVNKMQSRSYDGLITIYEKHLMVLEVQENSKLMPKVGLPQFNDFVTLEETETKKVEHHWTWMDSDEAYHKVTGANFDKDF